MSYDANCTSVMTTWTAPFSCNLTYAERNLAYCVNVFEINEEKRVHVLTDCTVFLESYVYSPDNPNPNATYEVSIIPRSNVNGARNGTASGPITARFAPNCEATTSPPIATTVYNETSEPPTDLVPGSGFGITPVIRTIILLAVLVLLIWYALH